MHRSTWLPGNFRTLVCILAGLTLTQQGRAQDDTNAALVDGTTWAQAMNQVMGGTSTTLPGSSGIRGPKGIYAIAMLSALIPQAQKAAMLSRSDTPLGLPSLTVDEALTNYFGYLLANSAVSGILLIADWKDLSPGDPGSDPSTPNPGSLALNYIDDAFTAIGTWNEQHRGSTPKTLQLALAPGFNSPPWLFDKLTSCDPLFVPSAPPPGSGCGYTTIFWETESGSPQQLPLPLPWNPSYKNEWKIFLTALSNHVGSHPEFVSIGVAGPTASSDEMILPNGNPSAADDNKNAGTLTLPSGPSVEVTVYQAWNSLLGNSYGATSSYVNSDRAFVEEWAAAIDMYGQLFSSVTLTVSTGNGLPNFPDASNPYLEVIPTAFWSDCATSTRMMDCAAETAILAYFAEPPVGGANAKATQEDGLTARENNGDVFPLSGASVKWLSQNTTGPLSAPFDVIDGGSWPVVGHMPVMSRMLGGLQLAESVVTHSAFEGCLTGTTCTPTPIPEEALLDVLTAYFAGTSAASNFGGGTANNGGAIVVNAPINYLQIWDTDILYAAGWYNCIPLALMNAPATPGGPPPGCTVDTKMPTVEPTWEGGAAWTAQFMLDLASYAIGLTQEAVTPPAVCGCTTGYVARGAFQGDAVCVTPAEKAQAASDYAKAIASPSTYATNETDYKFVPPLVPYGICPTSPTPLVYRQAYMGDYVCVTSSQATQVAADNASFPSRLQFCAAP